MITKFLFGVIFCSDNTGYSGSWGFQDRVPKLESLGTVQNQIRVCSGELKEFVAHFTSAYLMTRPGN